MTERERKILASTNAVRTYEQRRRDHKVLENLVAAVAGFTMTALFAMVLVILA